MRGKWTLLVGDWVVLTLISVLGFMFHNTLSVATLPRLLGSIVVTGLAWALAAIPTGAVDPARGASPRAWWRWVWAGVLAVPLALALYEFPRGRVVTWAFARALGTFALSGIVLWRLVYWLVWGRRQAA